LAYRKAKVLMACLAGVLVQGSAVAVAPESATQPVPQIHSTGSGRGDAGNLAALQRLFARLLHRTPAPLPRPGNWALVLAGLIVVGAIARRRAALMRDRSLAVRPPAGASRPHARGGAAWQLSAGRPGAGNLSYGLAGLLLLPATDAPAQAQDPAKLTPFVQEALTADDNVFRMSKDVDPTTAIGSSSRGDTYRTTSFGLSAEMPVSLQRFVANLTFNNTRYQRFSGLDSDGHELRGSWLWQAGRDLHGELGYADTVSLASFAQLLSITPDRLRVRQEFVNGTWMVSPYWRLRAAGDRLEQRNSAPATLFNDVTVDGVEAALSRVSKAGNSVGFSTRFESGHFPTPEPLGTGFIDNAYRQYAAGLALDWTISGVSHLVARADQVSRRYDQLPQRNFSGQAGHAELTWTPTGKFSLTAIAQHDISPYEYIRSSLVLLKGFGLRTLWRVTPKIELSADLEAVTRSYVADAAQALGFTGQRDDRVRSMSALFSYHPLKSLTVQASLLHETRSSNAAFGDYAVNVAGISARIAF
jgi:exopolysaccharide biosynthesis operon protein EpsL